MLVLTTTAASFRLQKSIITGMVNELHKVNMIASWNELVAKFGCIILLDQFDKKGRETICPFSSVAALVMLKSALCSAYICFKEHCTLLIAMEMLSSRKRKAKIKKNCH